MGAKFTDWFLDIIFTLVGAGIITAGIFANNSMTEFRKVAIETTATVSSVRTEENSDGDTYYRVYVKYNVDDKEYTGNFNAKVRYPIGSSITVYYASNNPNNMSTTLSYSLSWGMVVFGLIFFSVGASLLGVKIYSLSKKNSLLKNGEMIYAEINDVEVNTSYTVNDRHPFVIICVGTGVNGEKCTFKSENLWFNPQRIIEMYDIDVLPVYIDSKNPKRYYVSTKEIENAKVYD